MASISTQVKSWKPDRPVSKGATAFHNAVANSTWIKDILHELTSVVRSEINNGNIVVDFGAGTGTSAMLILKNLQKQIHLWLVDNSPSWLAKAYELLSNKPNVRYFILEKKENGYATLAETVGESVVDHVISANTVHLIPEINETFVGIFLALKKGGTFTFQTGNFMRNGRPDGALMIDYTVKRVHDIALDIVRSDDRFSAYRKFLDERIKEEESQRKFVFPDPRTIEVYLDALRSSGFSHQKPIYIPVRIRYSDWLDFLRVKRLQAGILPEIGGKEPSQQEEEDRDTLITKAALQLFDDLKMNNPLATDEYFMVECTYVLSRKV